MHGFADHAVAAGEAFRRGDLAAVPAAISDEMVDAYCAAGPLDKVRARVEATGWPLLNALTAQSWGQTDFRVADPDRRHLASFTAFRLSGIILWGKRRAPEDMRELYYDVGPNFYWELTKALGREAARSLSAFDP